MEYSLLRPCPQPFRIFPTLTEKRCNAPGSRRTLWGFKDAHATGDDHPTLRASMSIRELCVTSTPSASIC
jgi:hypothetical protein